MRTPAILSFFFFVLTSFVCRADDLSVVDVRSNIPLSEEEPAYKDFYLAGGDVSALKKNLVVTAVRKITIRDSKGAQAYGDIAVPVGQLKVIAVYGKVAVAREYKLLPRDENPTLEQVGIMSGDQIDLKDAFVDSAKPAPAKKKSAELAKPEPVTTASVSTAVPGAIRVAASEIEISRPDISRPEMSESGTSVYGAPSPKKSDAALIEEPSAPSKTPASVKKSPATLEEVDEEAATAIHPSASPKKAPVFKPVDHLPTGDEE